MLSGFYKFHHGALTSFNPNASIPQRPYLNDHDKVLVEFYVYISKNQTFRVHKYPSPSDFYTLNKIHPLAPAKSTIIIDRLQ